MLSLTKKKQKNR